MLERMQNIFSLQNYVDEHEKRVARLLIPITITIFIGAIIISIFVAVQTSSGDSQITFTGVVYGVAGAISIIALVSMLLVRYQKTALASVLLITMLWAGFTTYIVVETGTQDEVMASFTIIIALASVTLKKRGLIFYTLLVSLTTTTVYTAESIGLLPTIPAGLDSLAFLNTVYIIIAIVLNYATTYTEDALQNARENEQELRTSNLALQAIQENLEATVNDRTQALQRRARFLEAAAEVGRVSTSIYNIDELLPQITQFISERFGFYQVGIFILDEIGEYAVLRAANSPGGQIMLARGHRLKVGEEGIVGFVTGFGQPRIALDVGMDAVHFNTPELPETRSEMALPLFAGGRLFGALDVQSKEAGAFSEDDIVALRVLANQVAMAINNAQLFEQLQKSIEAERRAYGEVTYTSWRNLIHRQKTWGYRFANRQLQPISSQWRSEMIDAIRSEKVVQVEREDGTFAVVQPILVSNQPIGAIYFSKKTPWVTEETILLENLTNQIGQALESARLYAETQRRAMQEQLTSEVSTQIRHSLDLDDVLRTAVREFGQAFGAEEVVIRLNPEDREPFTT
jgi:GAF domain-containing protein